jgi:hypothetical protein
MSKQVIQRYIFDPIARTVTLPDFDKIDLSRLALITNLADNVILFNFGDETRTATVAGNVITLAYPTGSMSASDPLRIDYDTVFGDINYDRIVVGNARNKFRDGFASTEVSQPNPALWDITNDDPAGHLITQGGNSFGSSYLRVSLSPFDDGSEVTLTSKSLVRFPTKVGFGISMSQRIVGQEVFFGLVGVNAAGVIEKTATPGDKALSGTVSITSNVGTITLPGHGFNGGDRVNIFGCAEHRLNVGPVTVTVVDVNTFTVPITLTNGSYSAAGGVIRFADPTRDTKNVAGLLFENTTTTNASFVARRNGAKFRSTNNTVASSGATQSNTNPFTDAFNSAATHELYCSLDEVAFRSFAADSTAGMNGMAKFTQGIPDEEVDYKIHIRARNLTGISRPVARVLTVAKSGTSTATVVTNEPHGLAINDYVQVYGVRDQTNFPNLIAQTVVASVIDANTFTTVIGSAATANSVGGVVFKNEGSVLAPGAINGSIQSVSRTGGILQVTMNGTGHGIGSGNYGEFHHLWGMDAAGIYEGAYKLVRVSSAILEYEAPGPDFTLVNTGGGVIKRTDVRLHYARVMDYTRLAVEIMGGKGNQNDQNNSVPVTVSAMPTTTVTQSTGSSTNQWSAAGYGGYLVNDVASAAITSTATTSAITPGLLANFGGYAHSFNVVVTAVSGTTPTMDIGVEESLDNGTNWVRIYDFPRITANGAYTSPLIRAQYGTRYRYVQTLAGTTPSFTRSINRLMVSSPAPLHRQFFDRSIVLTTLNSVTPTYTVDGAHKLQLIVNVGAITTTAPQLQLEGSEDGSTWYLIGTPLTAVASSTVVAAVNDVSYPKFIRARVSTAGVGVTAGYVSLKAIGM